MPQSDSTSDKPWLILPPSPSLPEGQNKSGIVDINGARIWHASYGKGPPVILLHGGLANSNWNAHQIEALKQNHRVIVVDSRGHGRSTYDPNQPFTYDLLARDVIGVMDHLGVPRAALIGWSDGGIIGLVAALKYPAKVSAVVAMGVNVRPDGLGIDEETFGKDPVAIDYLERTAHERERLSPAPSNGAEFTEAVIAMWEREPNISNKQLATIKASVLVVHGDHDEWIKIDHAREIAENIPNATFVEMKDANHFGFLQRPEAFNESMVEFLSKPESFARRHAPGRDLAR